LICIKVKVELGSLKFGSHHYNRLTASNYAIMGVVKKNNLIAPFAVFTSTLLIPSYCNFQPQKENQYCSYVHPFLEPSNQEKFPPFQNIEINERISSFMTSSGTVTASGVSPYFVYPRTISLK